MAFWRQKSRPDAQQMSTGWMRQTSTRASAKKEIETLIKNVLTDFEVFDWFSVELRKM
jgi:hypothetical protein